MQLQWGGLDRRWMQARAILGMLSKSVIASTIAMREKIRVL